MYRKKILTKDEFQKITDDIKKCKVECKHCKHKVIIARNTKALCDYCGYYVFKTPKDEFLYRMMERLNRTK